MSLEEIKEEIKNIAGGVVEAKSEERRKIKTPFLKYGGPSIRIPKMPLNILNPVEPIKTLEKSESPEEPLVPAQPLNIEKEENK